MGLKHDLSLQDKIPLGKPDIMPGYCSCGWMHVWVYVYR